MTWPPRWPSASPGPLSSCTRPGRTCWRSATSPQPHWRKVWSTNLLERVNEEIKRRTRVVGIFPNDAADHPPGGGGAAGAGRALAAGGPPHVLRREHGRHPLAGGSANPAGSQRITGGTEAPGDRGRSAPTGRSGTITARGPAPLRHGTPEDGSRRQHRPSGDPDERLDKSIVRIHRETTRCRCTSGMTARHSTLFTLRSGQSGLGFYTTRRDAALVGLN
jgi:hypothetical protein